MDAVDPRWAFYWRALSGDRSGWDDEGAPWPGFYRFRYGPRHLWQACAIWDSAAGDLLAVQGDLSSPGKLTKAKPLVLWSSMHCWMSPVHEDAYHHAVKHGEWWDTLRSGGDSAEPGKIVTDVTKAAPLGPPIKRG